MRFVRGNVLKTIVGAVLTASAFLLGSPAFAAPIVINDTTTGNPTWNRPLAGNPPTALSGVGTATPYDFNAFVVTASGTYTVQSVATTTPAWDNFSFLYSNAFNPAAPLANVIIGNDDNPTIGLSGFTVALTAGVTYFLVETGFSNTDFGTYTATITQVVPTAVPEPGTAALLGIALVVVALGRRRARRG